MSVGKQWCVECGAQGKAVAASVIIDAEPLCHSCARTERVPHPEVPNPEAVFTIPETPIRVHGVDPESNRTCSIEGCVTPIGYTNKSGFYTAHYYEGNKDRLRDKRLAAKTTAAPPLLEAKQTAMLERNITAKRKPAAPPARTEPKVEPERKAPCVSFTEPEHEPTPVLEAKPQPVEADTVTIPDVPVECLDRWFAGLTGIDKAEAFSRWLQR